MFPFIARRSNAARRGGESHRRLLAIRPTRSGAGSSHHHHHWRPVQELDARRINARYTYRAGAVRAVYPHSSPGHGFLQQSDVQRRVGRPTSQHLRTAMRSSASSAMILMARAYFIASRGALPSPCFSWACCSRRSFSARSATATSSPQTITSTAGRQPPISWVTFRRALRRQFSVDLGYQNKVLAVRFGTEFLLLPTAHFIYGLCVSGNRSRVYRALTHWFHWPSEDKLCRVSPQFPLWVYTDVVETGTFQDDSPCDRYNPETRRAG